MNHKIVHLYSLNMLFYIFPCVVPVPMDWELQLCQLRNPRLLPSAPSHMHSQGWRPITFARKQSRKWWASNGVMQGKPMREWKRTDDVKKFQRTQFCWVQWNPDGVLSNPTNWVQ
ncbi:hypothetical protein SLEP1_g45549 [Rubroshorea leprosula]|uniref:Uncharacterized protein n=1 Tax=Rubroshorea leprosula TaxID=152421 RepID=A0AAV5LLZ4_9ROSI|nr:hypothetical protein SLEP1_g45549 [Rubroshorea leprosula]